MLKIKNRSQGHFIVLGRIMPVFILQVGLRP